MLPSKIIRDTRYQMRLTLREFAALVGAALPLGCSYQAVDTWESGATPPFEKMYFLYTFSTSPEIKAMAGEVMAAMKPELWNSIAQNAPVCTSSTRGMSGDISGDIAIPQGV